MKRAIIITAILALAAGVGGGVWLKTQLDSQTAAKTAQEQPQSKSEPSKYDVGPPDPQELLELVNEERKRVGVPPLQYDENVAKSAQLKADDMAIKGYRQHNIPGTNSMLSPEMANYMYAKAGCVRATENFYWAEFLATSRDAFSWWMSSKPHREAIQDPQQVRTGFGVKYDNDKTNVTQHFCEPR